jgi:hypothetical protein
MTEYFINAIALFAAFLLIKQLSCCQNNRGELHFRNIMKPLIIYSDIRHGGGNDMAQFTVQDMPNGISEYFAEKLAQCIARGIVEKSIRAIHNKNELCNMNMDSKVEKSQN